LQSNWFALRFSTICFCFSLLLFRIFPFWYHLCHHHSATLLRLLFLCTWHKFQIIFLDSEILPVLYTSTIVENGVSPLERVAPLPSTAESRRPPMAHPFRFPQPYEVPSSLGVCTHPVPLLRSIIVPLILHPPLPSPLPSPSCHPTCAHAHIPLMPSRMLCHHLRAASGTRRAPYYIILCSYNMVQ